MVPLHALEYAAVWGDSKAASLSHLQQEAPGIGLEEEGIASGLKYFCYKAATEHKIWAHTVEFWPQRQKFFSPQGAAGTVLITIAWALEGREPGTLMKSY